MPTYYVDTAAANDNGAGTAPETAWKTIAKVNGAAFSNGDSILFKRGCVWRESLTVPHDSLTLGAYGTGVLPKITGCDLLTGWTAYEAPSTGLFSDGFESGDKSAWSSVVGDGAHIAVSDAAALVGSKGLAVQIADGITHQVVDTTPNNETIYRCRFYVDPNSITMAVNDSILICGAKRSTTTDCFLVKLTKYANGYHIQCYFNANSGAVQPDVLITDAPHYVEIEWKAETGATTNDGIVALYVDGATIQRVTNYDTNGYNVATVNIGTYILTNTGTSGTLYLDAFYSNNTGDLIGATDPVVETDIYQATCDNGIGSYVLLEDGDHLTKVANLAAVTGAGKWWPDDANDTIYAWATDSADPDTHVMEIGTRYFTCDATDRQHLTIEDLHFHGAGGQYGGNFLVAPNAAVPTDITLRRCEMSYAWYVGYYVIHKDGSDPISNVSAYNCLIHHNLQWGIRIEGESAAALMTGIVLDSCEGHHNGNTVNGQLPISISACDSPVVTRCLLHDNESPFDWGDNLYFSICPNVDVQHNETYGGNKGGIHLDVHSSGRVWYNVCHGHGLNGIWVEEHQTGAGDASTIYHNTCYHNLHGLVFGPGSTIFEVSGVTCKNNIFALNRRANVELNEDGAGADYLNNVVDYNSYQVDTGDPLYEGEFRAKAARENETFAQWKAYTSWDAHSISADPLLDSAYHLATNSPCIDKGVAVAGIGQVVNGAAPDMGAYEAEAAHRLRRAWRH